jgi:3-methyladenine DNA glycosylase AlkD
VNGFEAALRAHTDPTQIGVLQKRTAPSDAVFGIRMGDLFAVAKAHAAMPLDEVQELLTSPFYEVRMGAFCILDFQAKGRNPDRPALCALYLEHHDRITAWDMVDRAAPSVVGGHVTDAGPLRGLAAAADPLRRRTAITAPLWWVRHGGSLDGLFEIAAVLAGDHDPLVHKAVGIALTHAGGREPAQVERFLAEHDIPAALTRAARAKIA